MKNIRFKILVVLTMVLGALLVINKWPAAVPDEKRLIDNMELLYKTTQNGKTLFETATVYSAKQLEPLVGGEFYTYKNAHYVYFASLPKSGQWVVGTPYNKYMVDISRPFDQTQGNPCYIMAAHPKMPSVLTSCHDNN